jgi:hypothetical protein
MSMYQTLTDDERTILIGELEKLGHPPSWSEVDEIASRIVSPADIVIEETVSHEVGDIDPLADPFADFDDEEKG